MYVKGKRKSSLSKRKIQTDDKSSTNATTSNTKRGKLTLRPWLIKQVNDGRIPGLIWHDSSMTLIRIPWVHGSRQIWNIERHSALFRAWAEHSGRFDSQDVNPKRWKANFRCALNSLPDVHEVRYLRKKGQHGYKVYKLEMAKTKVSKNVKKLQTKATDQNMKSLNQVEDVTSSTDGCADEMNKSPDSTDDEKTYVTMTSRYQPVEMETTYMQPYNEDQLLLIVKEIMEQPEKYLHLIKEQLLTNTGSCVGNRNVTGGQ